MHRSYQEASRSRLLLPDNKKDTSDPKKKTQVTPKKRDTGDPPSGKKGGRVAEHRCRSVKDGMRCKHDRAPSRTLVASCWDPPAES